ncbi:28882_t:CDS:2, partial [Dentiscutata erythropus]
YPQILFGVFVVAKTCGYTEPARSRACGSPYKILLTDYENICEDVMKFIQNLKSSKDLNKVIKSVEDLNELIIKNSITLAELKKNNSKTSKRIDQFDNELKIPLKDLTNFVSKMYIGSYIMFGDDKIINV